MIERHWKGIAKPEQAENYIHHLETDTFPKLHTIHGFIRASVLKRAVDKGVEFLVITVWDSMTAIGEFAGDRPAVAVVPETVQRKMVAFDTMVAHYEVVKLDS